MCLLLKETYQHYLRTATGEKQVNKEHIGDGLTLADDPEQDPQACRQIMQNQLISVFGKGYQQSEKGSGS